MRRLLLVTPIITLLLCFSAGRVVADPVTGILLASNNAGGVMLITSGHLQPFGNIVVAGGSTGTFLPLVGMTGSIASANNTPGPQSITNYINFGPPGFNLTSINPGVLGSAQCGAAPAPGQACTPAGSIFNLNNNVGNFSVQWTVQGNFIGTLGEVTPYTGIFTTQIAGNYQQFISGLAAGGTFEVPYSMTFSVSPPTQTPEPATLLLISTGLAGIAVKVKRRKKQSTV